MKQLESIIPLITPFTNNRVDKQLAVDHGNDVLRGGMKYLFLAGTTGVGPSLSTQEKLDLLDAFSNIPDSIMLQVGSLNLEDSVDMARTAKKKKIHAVAALPDIIDYIICNIITCCIRVIVYYCRVLGGYLHIIFYKPFPFQSCEIIWRKCGNCMYLFLFRCPGHVH